MYFGWATAPTAGSVVRATDGRPYLARRLAVYWQLDVITRVTCSPLLYGDTANLPARLVMCASSPSLAPFACCVVSSAAISYGQPLTTA
jgi:hypothetical protein